MSEPASSIIITKTAQPAAQPTAAKLQKRSVFGQNNGVGYLFVAPWLIGFILFALIPMLISFALAFTDYDILGSANFIGLGNFQRMTQDIRYIHSLYATFKYVLISVPLRLIFALAVAMLMNTKRRGVYWYRAIYYVPSIIGSSVAVAVMWRQLFGNEGLINAILSGLGVPSVHWLGNPDTAIWTLIILAVWQFGSPMLIFLAGLRQIPEELYESASIDGANAWHKFRRVTLPMLTPVIFFNLIMQIISGFKVFTQAFIVTNGTGQPLDTTLLYSLYLYTRAFVNSQMGYASAMAWVMLIIIAVLTLIAFKLSSLWVFYESKEG